MLQMIKTERKLTPFLHYQVEDAGIEVAVDEDLANEDYVAIKTDDYYNSLHLGDTIKSIDYLVTVDCSCDVYVLYLLEFKNVGSPSHLQIKDIVEKFNNTINDFINARFNYIFLNDRYKYRAVHLYLVSDAYRVGERFKSHDEYVKFIERYNSVGRDSLKVDYSLSQRLFRIKNKPCRIKYALPKELMIQKEY